MRTLLKILFLSRVVARTATTSAMPFSHFVQRMSRRTIFTRNINATLEYKPRSEQQGVQLPWVSAWTKRRSTVLSSTAEDASSTLILPESVHLKLNSEAMTAKAEDEDKAEDLEEDKKKKKRRKSMLLTYKDPKSQGTYSGLNVSRRRFEAWIKYTLGRPAKSELIVEEEMENSPTVRESLREKWKTRQLLCDRTELMTVYDSDKHQGNDTDKAKQKRGGFRDLLHLYADRFYGILVDEKEETKESLTNWLLREYGNNETQQLIAATFRQQARVEQFRILQHFLEWFRSQYPYYYDRCGSCGSSYKEERKDNDENDDGSFLGYVFPSEDELSGKAGRTELYQCHKCQSFTRFPRFNKAQAVLDKRRGRCGEYSMLLYRMLSSLGHETRWIVDWADHVWTEILLDDNEWIHLDPCEAAVDKPLLYQEWGKQQTYILGFYAPPHRKEMKPFRFPAIEDLTKKYTSHDIKTINERREESTREFDAALATIAEHLRQKITNLTATS